jgi:2-polyprenyl-3-methyl-5-hydroxy-6-metoxy-1,4-benzoquinol methylase
VLVRLYLNLTSIDIVNFKKVIYHNVLAKVRRMFLRATVMLNKPYQPIEGIKFIFQKRRPDSAFLKRWEIVNDVIKQYSPNNLLDIGCAEGFFARRAALEHGLFVVGCEFDWRPLGVGTAIAELKNEQGYGFVRIFLTPSTLKKLPKFDMVVCFSVLHHVIRKGGEEAGLEFLKSCASITGKCFLFEMGTPEEELNSWASELNFLKNMPKSIEENIKIYLKQAGFKQVDCLGQVLGYNRDAFRPIFLCLP